MKALVIIVLLAVAGWFAWSQGWFSGDDATEADPGTEGTDVFDTPEGSDGASGAAGTPTATDGLPAGLQQLLDSCEQRWAELSVDGANPGHSQSAPKLALDYSSILKATYNKPALKAQQQQIVNDRLLPLAQVLFFSGFRYTADETGIFHSHTVAQGERPDSIGREYGMSYQLINLMRQRPSEDGDLRLGETLKVVKAKDNGGYFVHVDKGDYFADVYICNILARRYDVGIGAIESPTPVGKAHIDMRSLEPDWTDPNTGEVYAWNDPRNLLGRVWLRLKSDEIGQQGIGLHGFNGDPEQAVKVQASNGCVRMRNADAEELYNIMVPVGYYESGFIQRAPMVVEIVE